MFAATDLQEQGINTIPVQTISLTHFLDTSCCVIFMQIPFMRLFLLPAFLFLLSGTLHAQDRRGTAFSGQLAGDPGPCTNAAANFLTEQDVNRLITDMLDRIDIRNRFLIVACRQIENCQATLYKGKPYILYNPDFLDEVKRMNFSATDIRMSTRNWVALTILAHELGHHVNNHLLNPHPEATQREMELEADEFAGAMIFRMGGTRTQAMAAYHSQPERGSYEHPGRQQRLDAVTRGWDKVKARTPDPKPEPVRPVPRPEPVKPEPVKPANAYAAVNIGDLSWMSRNLDVDRFRNGDPIPEARTAAEWKAAGENRQPAWCYHDNLTSNGARYGKLYNWYAVTDPRGLAPEGWHVATDTEWKSIISALGGSKAASVKLRAMTGWPEGNGTNTAGFNALPGQQRGQEGQFSSGTRDRAIWWTATPYKQDYGIIAFLDQSTGGERWGTNGIHVSPGHGKGAGCSVRCVRD